MWDGHLGTDKLNGKLGNIISPNCGNLGLFEQPHHYQVVHIYGWYMNLVFDGICILRGAGANLGV